jgi:polyphosphate kinase
MSTSGESRFFNRELSWIEFNSRVLEQALRPDVPLLERLKFVCIVTSNFDEFFMVRVAAVKRQVLAGDHVQCPSGIAPSALMGRITERVGELVARKYACLLDEILPALAKEGIIMRRPATYTDEQATFLKKLFGDEIFPVLTPVRATPGSELPYTANLRLHAAFLVEPSDSAELLSGDGERPSGEFLAIVQIPQSLDRLVFLPDEQDVVSFALLEDIIVEHAHTLFPGYTIREHCLFRVTRDADMGVDEERDEDFVEAMEKIVADREHSRAVRLSVSRNAGQLRVMLSQAMDVPLPEVYDKAEPLDLGSFMRLTSLPGFDHLRFDRWQPVESPALPEDSDIWDVVKRRDVLLHHPFESFEPVVRLVNQAADDPDVLAIKMTLYRTSGDSPIVRALERAAKNQKQVTALVEIKARFDEERNISWAQRLEQAGVIVVYGVARLKVHAKALFIVRREKRGITRYIHLGTGNYNDKTAKLYTDFGLLTSDQDIAYEVGLFFNAITGYSAIPTLRTLVMAPVGLKTKILQLIERETLRAQSGIEGEILAKLNSLADPDVIEALYRASQAGVTVKLNVRGVCMLVPGVKGQSEHITVVSVVDRFLEHARAFYFHNGGQPEIYCSSADWMPRNLERRVELMFPIRDETAAARVRETLEAAFSDNTNAHLMEADGTSVRVKGRKTFQSQRHLQELAATRAHRDAGADQKVFEVRRRPPEA